MKKEMSLKKVGMLVVLSIFVLMGIVGVWAVELNVYSPISDEIYSSRMVALNLTFGENVNFRYAKYSKDGERYVTLCRNCDDYGYSRVRRKPFDDGFRTIFIKLISDEGEVESSVDFFVDSKKPRILRTWPNEGSIVNTGEFRVRYDEENLQSVSLFYGFGTEEVVKVDCPSGKRKECVFNVDLSEYDGKEIYYWFEIKDYFVTTESRKIKVIVDLSSPLLEINSPKECIDYGGRVPFNISVSEKVNLEYSDNSGSWRRLCRRCDEYGLNRLKRKVFNEGYHNLLIRATDRVGNSNVEGVSFCVGGGCEGCGGYVPPEPVPELECYVDNDCNGDYYGDDYCNINILKDFHNFTCIENICMENIFSELVEFCYYGCESEVCLGEPESPGPEEIHDVGLMEGYDGFGHIIKINDPENNPIEDDVPVVDCSSGYDVKFLTENLGDFIEDVDIRLEIKKGAEVVYSHDRTNELDVGETTTTGYKNNFVFVEAGDYVVRVEVSINDDVDLSNNGAERAVEVVC